MISHRPPGLRFEAVETEIPGRRVKVWSDTFASEKGGRNTAMSYISRWVNAGKRRGEQEPEGPTGTVDADLVRKVTARFARGNISAQEGRLLLKDERAIRYAKARTIALAWKTRGEQK